MYFYICILIAITIIISVWSYRKIKEQSIELDNIKNRCKSLESEINKFKFDQEKDIIEKVRDLAEMHRESANNFERMTQFEDDQFEEFIKFKYKKEIAAGQSIKDIIKREEMLKRLESLKLPEDDEALDEE